MFKLLLIKNLMKYFNFSLNLQICKKNQLADSLEDNVILFIKFINYLMKLLILILFSIFLKEIFNQKLIQSINSLNLLEIKFPNCQINVKNYHLNKKYVRYK